MIQDASKRFMEEFGVEDQQFMVVHFRSEKLGSTGSLDSCQTASTRDCK